MRAFVVVGILGYGLTFCVAQQTVRLNNKDADMPIYLFEEGNLAPQSEVRVDVLAGIGGGIMGRVNSVGTDTMTFPLSEDGFFDAGLGNVGGLGDSPTVTFQIRAWLRAEDATLSYEGSAVRGESSVWEQRFGDPVLHIPAPGHAAPITEPSAVFLGVLGAAALLAKRLAETPRQKPPRTRYSRPGPA